MRSSQQEMFLRQRSRLSLGNLWLLFAQAVTVIMALLFVVTLVGLRFGEQTPIERIGLGPEFTFRHSLDRILPSVVSIRASVLKDGAEAVRTLEYANLGSGVIVSEQGHIVTNYHVVKAAEEIEILTSTGKSLPANIVGWDPDIDIAVLKLETTEPMVPARFQSKNNPLQVGDMVMSVGSPYGLVNTASMGIVSATGRSNLGLANYEYFIQTDAAINHGSSGGALANVHGELVGLNTALFSKQFNGNFAQGIGFAIPAELVNVAYDEIVRYGHFRRGWIGVDLSRLDGTLGKSSLDALQVNEVDYDSPADKAGILPGDLILKIDGRAPSTISFLEEATGQLLKPGKKLSLLVMRDGTEIDFSVEVIEININYASE